MTLAAVLGAHTQSVRANTDVHRDLTKNDVVAAFRASGIEPETYPGNTNMSFDGSMLSIGPFDDGWAAVTVLILPSALDARAYKGAAVWNGTNGIRRRVVNVLLWTKPGLIRAGQHRVARAVMLLRRASQR
jgi:hypothetical protein